MMVLGLTGSIGMGKSTTAGLFREAGVPVFDADAVVHALYAGKAAAAVEAAFPGATGPGGVDRAALRDRVVGDPAALHRLEGIVHPLVRRERAAFLEAAKGRGEPVVVLDIPLLYETGADAEVDAVVVVSAAESVQKSRVMARPGMTEEAFSAMLRKQVPDAEKRRRATYVIDTGRGVEAARADVHALLRRLGQG